MFISIISFLVKTETDDVYTDDLATAAQFRSCSVNRSLHCSAKELKVERRWAN